MSVLSQYIKSITDWGIGMTCPKCHRNHVISQTFQENRGSVTRTRSKYREKGHGCLWWLLIGSWWWIVDLFLWVFLFVPRALLHIRRRKTYVGNSRSVTRNEIRYRTVYTCQDCGHTWTR